MGKWNLKLLVCVGCIAGCNGRGPTAPPASTAAAESGKPALKVMEEKQREYLWEIEHHGNVLNRIGFPALTTALKKEDKDSLASILAPEFEGELLQAPKQTAVETDFLHLVREQDAGKPGLKVDGGQFIDKLMEYRRAFNSIAGAKLALIRLTPTNPDDLDAAWEGTGQLRLWGQKSPGKPAEAIIYIRYKTVRPTKHAMAAGKWLLGCSVTQAQLGSSEHMLMREAAAERGLEPGRMADKWTDGAEALDGGVFLSDYDRDGYLDVLLTDINGYFLYHNEGGKSFRNVTSDMGLPELVQDSISRSRVAGWVDLDGDGWEDLILGFSVYRNEDGKRFVSVTDRCNLRLPEKTVGVAVADYDNDSRMDVYIFQAGIGKADSWLDGKAGTGHLNRLLRNLGDWKFEDVTATSGTDGGARSCFTAVWFDANNDGWQDLHVPNEFGNGVLYINQGNGTFRPGSLGDGPVDFGTMGATAGDINNDGNTDLFLGSMYSKAGTRVINNVLPGTYSPEIMAQMLSFVKGNELHLNRGGLKFEQLGKAMQVNDAGWAYGPALVDLDNDGWLDIHSTAGFISKDRNEPDG